MEQCFEGKGSERKILNLAYTVKVKPYAVKKWLIIVYFLLINCIAQLLTTKIKTMKTSHNIGLRYVNKMI